MPSVKGWTLSALADPPEPAALPARAVTPPLAVPLALPATAVPPPVLVAALTAEGSLAPVGCGSAGFATGSVTAGWFTGTTLGGSVSTTFTISGALVARARTGLTIGVCVGLAAAGAICSGCSG